MSENQSGSGNKKSLIIVIAVFAALIAIMFFLMNGSDVHIDGGH